MSASLPLWVMVAAMALVTYLIRAVPFVLFRRRIRSRFLRSLLSYMPYAVLSAVTLRGRSLLVVAVCACAAALLAELLLPLL